MIRVWQSYACNNSAAYRLIARFADAAAAAEVAAELDEFFVAQKKSRNRKGELGVLAKNYGFDWTDMSSGDPGVVVQDEVVVVYHTICLGMGPGVAAYIQDRGGIPESQSRSELQISTPFRIDPSSEVQRYDELVVLIASLVDTEQQVMLLQPPWADGVPRGNAVWFRDAGMIGLHLPIRPANLEAFKAWLAGFGIADYVLRIEERGDRELFPALAAARCTSCDRKLEYLDPRLHDIETPQLVCGCGGLYELATFYTP